MALSHWRLGCLQTLLTLAKALYVLSWLFFALESKSLQLGWLCFTKDQPFCVVPCGFKFEKQCSLNGEYDIQNIYSDVDAEGSRILKSL